MTNIQSAMAEIRRGKKKKEERRRRRTNDTMKIGMVQFHRVTIINNNTKHTVYRFYCH